MIIADAVLEQVLEFREERSVIQRELIGQWQEPLISFTMNIAGPRKRTPLTEFAFDETIKDIRQLLGEPKEYRELRSAAGCEAFFVYPRTAAELKKNAVRLEEQTSAGRLLDIDVLTPLGEKLSRGNERKCLICDGPAFPCARSRKHTVEEIERKTRQLLCDFAVDRISGYAVQAMLDEVRLTPKPGLVDMANNGAHQDMNLELMEKSANSLRTYFQTAVWLGIEKGDACVRELQSAGIEAEKTMFSTTGGVNTHKGAVFLLGLLCAGTGRLLGEAGGDVFADAARIAAGLRSGPDITHGAAVKKRFKAGGARAEALAGFPHVVMAYRLLHRGASQYEVLLSLLRDVEDSNLLWRGGKDGLAYVQNTAKRILTMEKEQRERELLKFDEECIRRNLSPGGSADLLACALFLNYLPFTRL